MAGATAKSIRATALATAEQSLSLPKMSTAVIDTKYSAPAESPVSLNVTVWFGGGLGVGDATTKEEDPGQGGSEAP